MKHTSLFLFLLFVVIAIGCAYISYTSEGVAAAIWGFCAVVNLGTASTYLYIYLRYELRYRRDE